MRLLFFLLVVIVGVVSGFRESPPVTLSKPAALAATGSGSGSGSGSQETFVKAEPPKPNEPNPNDDKKEALKSLKKDIDEKVAKATEEAAKDNEGLSTEDLQDPARGDQSKDSQSTANLATP